MARLPIPESTAKDELARINAILPSPHLLIGGLAVQQYHSIRRSQDIDLVCSFDTAQSILKQLYESSDWVIQNLRDDEYRPSYRITHRFKDRGTIIFGPKILEREPYDSIDWQALQAEAVPFQAHGATLTKILVPTVATLAFTKLLSFVGRISRLPEKGLQDLQDFVDLSNHKGFSLHDFYNIVRVSGTDSQLRDDLGRMAPGHSDILAKSAIVGCALTVGIFHSVESRSEGAMPPEPALSARILVSEESDFDDVNPLASEVDSSGEDYKLEVPGHRSLPIKCFKQPYGGQRLVNSIPAGIGGRVLDLGTGCGLIGLAAAVMGAREVTMIDVIEAECDIARQNASLHNLRVTVVKHDYFIDLPIAPGPVDWILANPPVLPSRHQFDRRECGGLTGWDHVDRIMAIGRERLSADGNMILYLLDMLGIGSKTGQAESFDDRCRREGFAWEVVGRYKRKVGPLSPVFRELRHIIEVCPLAEFWIDEQGSTIVHGRDAIDYALRGRPLYITTRTVRLWRSNGNEESTGISASRR